MFNLLFGVMYAGLAAWCFRDGLRQMRDRARDEAHRDARLEGLESRELEADARLEKLEKLAAGAPPVSENPMAKGA